MKETSLQGFSYLNNIIKHHTARRIKKAHAVKHVSGLCKNRQPDSQGINRNGNDDDKHKGKAPPNLLLHSAQFLFLHG